MTATTAPAALSAARRTDWRVPVAIVVCMVLWASAFVGIRAGLAGYAPGHYALLRFLVASATLGVIAVLKRMRPPRPRDVPALLLHGFLGFTVYHACLNYGEQTVSAAAACFLIIAIPIFTTLLAVLFLKETLTRRAVFGVLVSVVGIALISFGEGDSLDLNVGALYVLVAAFAESVFIVLQKPFLRRYSPLEYVTWTVLAGTFFLLAFSPGFFAAVAAAPLPATLAGIYLGIFPAAVAYVAWAYALARVEASKIVVTQYALPGLTLLIGWAWLGELPTMVSLAGGLVALFGVVIITLPARRAVPAA